MIPTYFLSKLRPYEVQVHGVKVKATVVANNVSFLEQKLSELSSKRVVGVDVKFQSRVASLLLLCVEGHCLIIPIRAPFSTVFNPKKVSDSGLGRLLADQNICFVYSKFKSEDATSYAGLPEMMKQTGIEVDHLAATILKKPTLLRKGLYELGREVGIDIKSAYYVKYTNWSDVKVFSEEEIKYAIHDVYATFLIGNKLLGTLAS
ncbi:hypothetical protein ACLB2K_057166 [Fragaria x ananassa]